MDPFNDIYVHRERERDERLEGTETTAILLTTTKKRYTIT